jgi:hypothetical protein
VAGYVIMPNHLHVLLYLSHSGTSLNILVGEGKRFMAYAIVSGLKKARKENLLRELEEGVTLPGARFQLPGGGVNWFRRSWHPVTGIWQLLMSPTYH